MVLSGPQVTYVDGSGTAWATRGGVCEEWRRALWLALYLDPLAIKAKSVKLAEDLSRLRWINRRGSTHTYNEDRL